MIEVRIDEHHKRLVLVLGQPEIAPRPTADPRAADLLFAVLGRAGGEARHPAPPGAADQPLH